MEQVEDYLIYLNITIPLKFEGYFKSEKRGFREVTIFLLHWAIFLFLVGLILSLPLAAIYYLNHSDVRQLFANPRKLKGAHLDYFMQAFSIGLIYILELGMHASVPIYVVIPLAFGTLFNPFILLLEGTPLYTVGFGKFFYNFLKAVSPASFLFAWFVLLFQYLPIYYSGLLAGFVIIFIIAFLVNKKRINKKDVSLNKNA